MRLEDLGYNDELQMYRQENGLNSFDVGRVISEHKERYVVKTETGECDSELIGNLRFTAGSRYDFPAVGDWVALSEYDDGKALIHAIYPRSSIIERKAVAKAGQVQIIASKVTPMIVLSKIDLIPKSDLDDILLGLRDRIGNIQIFTVSSEVEKGYDDLIMSIEKGKTYCLLGSSGVGKSTLSNFLSGRQQMKTDTISESTSKGRHVTSHRELIVLENGGILIDNPGMREVGIADTSSGLEITFDAILTLSENCRFKDCTHLHEKGCAILEALENGEIDEGAYHNYQKLEREKLHFESSAEEKRKKDKEFGKMIKTHKKMRKKNKF